MHPFDAERPFSSLSMPELENQALKFDYGKLLSDHAEVVTLDDDDDVIIQPTPTPPVTNNNKVRLKLQPKGQKTKPRKAIQNNVR